MDLEFKGSPKSESSSTLVFDPELCAWSNAIPCSCPGKDPRVCHSSVHASSGAQ